MSKFTDELHDVQIINSHNFYVTMGTVHISYWPGSTGRIYQSAKWMVLCAGYETNPDAHFMDHKTKVFAVSRYSEEGTLKEIRARQLEKAKAWAEEHYGVKSWIKDPFGGWGDETYVKARVKALKAKLKALPFRTGDTVQVSGEEELKKIDGIYSEDRIHLEDEPMGYKAVYHKSSELTKVEQ